MERPNYKDCKDMVLCGVMASELVDSSGEICRIKGMDISSLEAGEGLCNYEHLSSSDGKGAEVVGRITYCKKIYTKTDCESPEQEFFFKEVKSKPYLYGEIRLADGAGHHEAQDLAAHIRDHLEHDKSILLRLSIEGSTIEKKDNVIEQSIARKVALTFTPCNKSANTKLIKDPNAPEGYKKVDIAKAEVMQDPANRKIGGSVELQYNPIISKNENSDIIINRLIKNITSIKALNKTMTAGCGESAPSALVGGAALQKEDVSRLYSTNVLAATRDYDGLWDRKKFKNHLKKYLAKASLPEVSEPFLDHFTDIAESVKLKKSEGKEPIDIMEKVLKLEECLIELRKDVRHVVEGTPNVEMPEVYQVRNHDDKGKSRSIGRFMISKGNLHHLEDYHGILEGAIPEGPVTPETSNSIQSLMASPNFDVAQHNLPKAETPIVNKLSVEKQETPQRPGVFSYFRAGMVKPHIVEFSPHGAALDGKGLSNDELTLMLENARKGLAKIKWGVHGDLLAKREATEDLMEADEALQHIRAAVQAGHIHPSVERALTKHIYEDSMVPGIGNKYAATKFRENNKPGVYASIDANDFKHINDMFGHDTGDEAIKTIGNALKGASEKVGTTKVFRPGGDEFVAHAPTHEDMAQFLRHTRQHVESLPPIAGIHRQSISAGIGHNFPKADEALGIAKQKKYDPVTKQRLHVPGQVPNLGHSLYPGQEGDVFKNQDTPPKAALS